MASIFKLSESDLICDQRIFWPEFDEEITQTSVYANETYTPVKLTFMAYQNCQK